MNFLHREVPSLHAAALILGGAALASKLLGLLRDRMLAERFGAGDTLDAYYAAFLIPDALYTLLLVGAASAAVLPVFVAYDRRGAAGVFLGNLLTVFSAVAGLAAALAILAAPRLMAVVAPGFDAGKLALAANMTRLMMVNVLFLGASGILSSALQARGRFFVFALPPVVYNLGIILGIVVFVPVLGAMGLAAGVVLGGIFQVLAQVPALAAMRFPLRLGFDFGEPGLGQVWRTSLPRVAAMAMSHLTLVVLAAMASSFAAGSIAVFRLASNLIYIPVGLFGVSYALAMFPKLSDQAVSGAGKKFGEQFLSGLKNILFWALPFAALFVVLRAHVVRVVLGSGAFDWEDTRLVAAVLAVLALAVVSESVIPLLLRGFYALQRTAEPLIWNIIASLAAVGLALGLSAWFSASPEALSGVAGVLRIGDLSQPRILAVAIGFALGSLLNAAFLLLAFRRTARQRFGLLLSFDFRTAANMAGAAVLAGFAAYAVLQPFPSLIETNTFFGILTQGAIAGLAGLSVYWTILWRQGNAEIRGLVESFRRRLVSIRKTPQVFETEKLDGEGGK